MENPKIIIVTGLSGSGSKDFCKSYAKLHDAKFFSTGDMLAKEAQPAQNRAPFSPENLLNLTPYTLEHLRDKIFDELSDELEKKEHERYIIDMHAQFFWDDVYHNAFDWKHLERIKADLYATIIDKPSSIKERQLQTELGRVQGHDLRDLLLWQNVEVNITNGWADKYGKPFYVLPSAQEPEMLESLLHNKFCIYFQMPMTGINEKANQQISDFKGKLLEFGKEVTGMPIPIIDPRHIDIETGKELSTKIELAIRRQTNHRDLNWYIRIDASDLVAYYPPGTNLSRGVSDETVRGLETGKNTFVIYQVPQSKTSPFMDRAKEVFETDEEFFKYFKEYLPKRVEQLKR